MKISSIKELRSFINSDAHRYNKCVCGGGGGMGIIKLYITTIGFRYTYWMRVCCYLRNRKFLFPLYILSRLRLSHLSHDSGIQICDNTQIGKGFYIGHFGTIVINGAAKLGNNVNISQGVTIGQTNRGSHKGVPTIGDCVYIGPGAKIVGAVRIGNNVAIGANAVVTKDIPDNACVAGVPAKIISMEGSVGYVNNLV